MNHDDIPHYFLTNCSDHFSLRPDFLHEILCHGFRLCQSPKDQISFDRWRTICAPSHGNLSFEQARILARGLKRDPDRVILVPVILRGEQQQRALIISPDWVRVSYAMEGIIEFVFHRAREYSHWLGWPIERVALMFKPHVFGRSKDLSAIASYAVGYDSKTGGCTILARYKEDTEARYLDGRGGYYVPSYF